jgi:hypothetical protein
MSTDPDKRPENCAASSPKLTAGADAGKMYGNRNKSGNKNKRLLFFTDTSWFRLGAGVAPVVGHAVRFTSFPARDLVFWLTELRFIADVWYDKHADL